MLSLGDAETLQSLIGRLDDDTAAGAGFRKLLQFLKQSRYGQRIEDAL
jgi:hypothetical protein